MSDYDVIVIGAGCGGLSAGALLARQGRKVLVLEQSERVGGCCSTFERDGYSFDLGATILEMTPILDKLFQKLGSSLDKELSLVSCDPVYSLITHDGSRFSYPVSSEGTARVIAGIDPEDGKSWTRYSRDFEEFVNYLVDDFLTKPANTIFDMMRSLRKLPHPFKYAPFFMGSYQDVIFKYFKNQTIRESMSFQSFYAGNPPELCGGHFSLLPYSEHQGVYYPKGGMIELPRAIQRCGERLGMETRLNTRVKKIMVHKKKTTGVVLADGTEISSDIVVSNINAKTLYLNMIGEEKLPRIVRRGIKSYDLSLSHPMIYLGVNYRPPIEAHHALITRPTSEINDYWWNKYKQGIFPDEQFGIVCCPTLSDPSLAPEGHHILLLTLAPGPYELRGSDWDTEKQGIMERVIDYYSKNFIPGLAEHVEVAAFSTPVDFERRLLSPGGAIYALAQDMPQTTCFRPAAKSKCLDGLYLTGASTHPGGGVATVIASGLIAADLIEKYE
ncbi:MAG: NAD(P)/FAD-dependent oxidoreductase [Firmicutes bacterium]|jgi:phytoene desaturase|nr:NAD(P)/FAD-dependent oxidoreductase [Bacillota bacterium]